MLVIHFFMDTAPSDAHIILPLCGPPPDLTCNYCEACTAEKEPVQFSLLELLHQHVKTHHLPNPTWQDGDASEFHGRQRVRRRKKRKGSQASGSQASKEEDLLTELCVALANTSIEQDRELREHTGSLNRVILMPISGAPTGFLADGVNEGEAFQQEVKENPGKDLGSPHIRIALKTIHSLITDVNLNKDPNVQQVQREIEQRWNKDVMVNGTRTTEMEIAQEILIFKMRMPEKQSTT